MATSANPAELEQEHATTRRLLERLPEDRLDWRPHAKSMTLGQLARHTATVTSQALHVSERDTAMEDMDIGNPQPESVAEIIAAHEADLAEARRILGGWDEERAASTWTVTSGDETVLSMQRAAVLRTIGCNHLYHHRGQLTVYLRLLDVPLPSVYGPTADEGPA